jgi:hypothetical protein
MYKDDFWSIGGNDEDFTRPAYEDYYLGEIIKRKYHINWCDNIVGLHQNHDRPKNLNKMIEPSRILCEEKLRQLK